MKFVPPYDPTSKREPYVFPWRLFFRSMLHWHSLMLALAVTFLLARFCHVDDWSWRVTVFAFMLLLSGIACVMGPKVDGRDPSPDENRFKDMGRFDRWW